MAYLAPEPQRFVPKTENNDILRPGDPLGAFVGYLRRAKASSAGLTAQFFGENGEDADVISALHLTRFLDAHVKVSVWMMKDRQGKIMKKNGEYQKLTEFIAQVRRPQPSNMGQVAMFFGQNGPNADAINILNQSEYLDALVYVEMHQALIGMTVKDVPTNTPDADIDEHAGRLTPTEAAELKKLQKKSENAMRELVLGGFFRQEPVLTVLGRETDFQAWIESQPCCHPGEKPCDNHPVVAFKVPHAKRYGYLPLCMHHKEMWENGSVDMVDGSSLPSYMQSQSITYLLRWGQHSLAKQLKVPSGYLPTPGAIHMWAIDNKVAHFISNTFKAYLS